jgi:hypothetical protein
MKRKIDFRMVSCSLLLFISSSLLAFSGTSDTCTVNDHCETAIAIDNVVADGEFVCIEGCNVNATPEFLSNACHIGEFPTVWYSVFAEDASLINIQVSSNEIESPVITLYQMFSNCNSLAIIPITIYNLPCLAGLNGVAEAFGTDITSNAQYLIAVSSLDSIGGAFTLCVNTISKASQCVTNSKVIIEARSFGGDLDGPFIPGEKVSVCMNVNSYSAVNNGCQWFQGLVPVFGNGWDPSSFDADGQPLNATINGNPMGVASNGLYGASTWDWFTDVDYHFDDPQRQVGDFDGNGTVDMCSKAYDPDCPDLGGIQGGCCGPCWGAPLGDILPPGWFAYGINGTCATPGPPVRVDWGDGNTCGSGMGPWKFCFDLVVREYPDCLLDETTSDLSLGFFTFADGETGSWTGITSICALDQPVKRTVPLTCIQVTDLGVEHVEDKCAESIFDYIISHPGIETWTWGISPSWLSPDTPKEGENGYAIHDSLVNPLSTPLEVIYTFAGYDQDPFNIVIKEVRGLLYPVIQSVLPSHLYICERDNDTLILSAEPVTGGLAPFQFLWSPGGDTTSSIAELPPFQSSTFTLDIVDSIGCTYQKEIQLIVHPCQLDTIMPDDDSNNPHTSDDPPILIGKQSGPDPEVNSSVYTNTLKIFPQPATDLVNIEWPGNIDDAMEILILDTRGSIVYRSILSETTQKDHSVQLHTGQYSGGVFVVVLQTRRSILSGRLVKI